MASLVPELKAEQESSVFSPGTVTITTDEPIKGSSLRTPSSLGVLILRVSPAILDLTTILSEDVVSSPVSELPDLSELISEGNALPKKVRIVELGSTVSPAIKVRSSSF